MRQNAPTGRLEDLSIIIPHDHIIFHMKGNEVPHPRFELGIRYGLRPSLDPKTGTVRCICLELVFARLKNRHVFTLPIAFEPRLELNAENAGNLGILQTLKTLELPKQDAQIFGILQYFSQLMSVYLCVEDRECQLFAAIVLASPGKQGPMQQSCGSALNPLQTTLLFMD